jgi:hypothetical protein
MMAATDRRHNGFVASGARRSRIFSSHLPFQNEHPILGVCSTNRKEVIRCRVISFSRTWPQRIALSGSSLPVKARDARQVTQNVAAMSRAMDGNTEGRRLRKKRRPFPFADYWVSATFSVFRMIS